MISHLHHEREQLLGAPKATTPPIDAKLPADPNGEAPAHERRINPARFMGFQNSFEILPSLGLSFADLRQAQKVSGGPILDVGASHSTLALEGALRGIEIHSTDLQADKYRLHFQTNLERRFNILKDIYVGDPKHPRTHAQKFPPGFECVPVPDFQWSDVVTNVLNRVNQTFSQCDASRILLADGSVAPDRMFSIVMSTQAVPKYSIDKHFLHNELRELLRVTDGRLVLFPFISAGPDHELLHVTNSPSRKIIEGVARELGFSFETKVYPPLIEPDSGIPARPGYDITAVFSRLGTRYPLPR